MTADPNVIAYLDFRLDPITGFYVTDFEQDDKRVQPLISQVNAQYAIQKKRHKRTVHFKNKWEAVLCEVMFGYMVPDGSYADTPDYDYIINGDTNQYKVEVKAKFRNTPPKVTDECGIQDYLLGKQQTDYYAFMYCSNLHNQTQVILCGFMEQSKYKDVSFKLAKGTRMAGGRIAKSTTYNVYCYQLIKPDDMMYFVMGEKKNGTN